jgi:hypothetical protein
MKRLDALPSASRTRRLKIRVGNGHFGVSGLQPLFRGVQNKDLVLLSLIIRAGSIPPVWAYNPDIPCTAWPSTGRIKARQ